MLFRSPSADRRILTLDPNVLDVLHRLEQPSVSAKLSLAIKKLGRLWRKSRQAAEDDLSNRGAKCEHIMSKISVSYCFYET